MKIRYLDLVLGLTVVLAMMVMITSLLFYLWPEMPTWVPTIVAFPVGWFIGPKVMDLMGIRPFESSDE